MTEVPEERLSNHVAPSPLKACTKLTSPVGIYQLDGIVRRAPALQMTADAREGVAP
jgi:hypothetical protein